MTTSLAPFGTHDTPSMRTKIVGGKPFMVAEDRHFAPKVPQTIEDLSPPGVSPRQRNTTGGNTSPRLAPLTEKPNYFDPTPFMAANNKRNLQMDTSPQQEMSSRSTMNPHPVVPPIMSNGAPYSDSTHHQPPQSEASGMTYRSNVPRAPHDLTELLKHLPRDQYLPRVPVTYPTKDELELRRRIHLDLKGYDPKRFKDTYTELTGYDRQLTGYINLQDLGYTLSRNQITLNALHLRLVAAMFVSPSDPGKVNYEKLLSFLAASQRDASSMPAGGPVTDPNAHLPRSQKYPYQDRDNAKLLRYLEEQLAGDLDDIDMEKVWNTFSRADREKRGTLSEEQIKDLVYSLGIPIQGSLITAIMDKCDYVNGQIRWEQFLEFINRVAPRKTGLKIPESKKPLEYVKHYPVPDTNWPKGDWENTEYGIPRNKQRPLPPHGQQHGSPLRQNNEPSDPNDYLPQYNPRQENLEELEARTQRQTEADRRNRSLDRVEDEYSTKLRKNPPPPDIDDTPWVKRFMTLATEVYDRDTGHVGKIDAEEFRRLTDQFNWSLQLQLPDQEVEAITRRHTQGGMVNLDLALRELGQLGPS